MLFPSEEFLFVFFPVVVAVYYLLCRKNVLLKNLVLLAASLYFYAWGEPVYVWMMVAVILLHYGDGFLVGKVFKDGSIGRKLSLAAMITVDVAILFHFKYSTFSVLQINRFLKTNLPVPLVALPIGISFFTFQAMSYVIDVYRGTCKVQKNPFYLGLYIAFFPQLIAGPIVRYETVEEQMVGRKESWELFCNGVARFIVGLAKKVLLANHMAQVADNAFSMIGGGVFHSTPAMAWLGAITYTLQLYFDFSGYTDMAIGLGKMFGFVFEENFRYPFVAHNFSDFWRRWHISMQSWFRDYVYFPMGGSRVKISGQIFNLFVVWLLTGIWHGANWTFIAWGLFNFVMISIEKFSGLSKKKFWWGHIYTLIFWVLGCTVFRADNLGEAVVYIKAMFGLGVSMAGDHAARTSLIQYAIFYIAAIPASLPIVPWLKDKVSGNEKAGKRLQAGFALSLTILFLICVTYILNNSYSPFIYFNF